MESVETLASTEKNIAAILSELGSVVVIVF